ncbi:hypothetical protein [Nocardia asteroides]|uniref:hypothetical protein n=1 Tax=Nocardia asteroides TaxID=1824 RepID=UPI0033FA6C62
MPAPSRAPARPRRLAAALARNAADALPLLFNIDESGHEYPADLLDLAASADRKATR